MVPMGMRQDDAAELVWVSADGPQKIFDLGIRSPALDEQGRAFALDEVTIAVAARGEGPDLHGRLPG